MSQCPECAERTDAADHACRFCGHRFDSTGEAQPARGVERNAPQRTRRRWFAGVGVVGVVVALLALVPGARDNIPGSVPVVGKDATDVFGQLQRAGLPITDGRPASSDYDDMIDRNGCKSSRPFVRTDTEDSGWGFICVKPPGAAYRQMNSAFDEVPMLAGPLFVDDGGGDVLVLGLGWPPDASKTMYTAIGGSGGSYLVEQD